jgi:hypothetical protein
MLGARVRLKHDFPLSNFYQMGLITKARMGQQLVYECDGCILP